MALPGNNWQLNLVTDLVTDLGKSGDYMAGGGITKALSERKRSIDKEHINEKENSNGKN